MSEDTTTDLEREQPILQTRLAGASECEMADKFELSRERIRLILRKNAGMFSQRTHQLLGEIRQADDLEKKWTVVDLLDALGLITVTRNALVNHFKWKKSNEISLRELMDLAISPKRDSRPGYLITPLLSLRYVGTRGIWSVVNGLTKVNLGERCNQEWKQRLERLKGCRRIRGGRPYSWSQPYEPPPEWLEEMTGEREI